jgi:hypothetical protein
MIDIFVILISLILFGAGLFVACMNWYCLYSYLINKKFYSRIPIIGGGLCAIGMYISPLNINSYIWLPFILDYGCLPDLLYTAYFYLFKYPKIKQDKK